MKKIKSLLSIIPRAIEEKCAFAEIAVKKPTIGAGIKIKNESKSVSEMQMMKLTKKAMI